MVAQVATEEVAIQVTGLCKQFGKFTAVKGIDLIIRKGETFALLGPNGAGKSTTIKMLSCLSLPTKGTATIMGHDIVKDPISAKQVIDLSPQDTAIAEHMNARENLELIGGVYGMPKAEVKQRTEELLELMGLHDRAKEQVRKYSGGMKRRLSIAMALVSNPDVLFLDEPTLGLDPQSRKSIWDQVKKYKGQKTIILTTHYLEEADAVADRIAIIDEGRIVTLGTPRELKDSVSEKQIMVIKANNVTDEVFKGLRDLYPDSIKTSDGIEIKADKVNFSEVIDYLRPKGVEIESTSQKQISLDDVFMHYTGKELR